MKGKTHNRITRFLIVSGSAFAVLCVIVFGFLSVYMNRQSTETIHVVGQTYMSSMSHQIASHFKTVVEFRLSQLETLVEATPPDAGRGVEELREELVENSQVHGFSYLAFLSREGEVEKMYGNDLTIADLDGFLEALNNDEPKVTVGADRDGNLEVLVAISVIYPMEGGTECTALVAGLPTSYVTETLGLDDDVSRVYSFIIRRDGSFVIRTNGAYRANYFDRARALYESAGRKTVDQYLTELGKAMDGRENYSSEVTIGGERRRVYLTTLEYSDWYLLACMPFGTMGSDIDQLSNQWFMVLTVACAAILAGLVLIFLGYWRMTRQQVQELEEARKTAWQASKAKSEFLSNMSHDIRTPLNAIVGMTAIAQEHVEDAYEVKNCLNKINRSSVHLLGLINDVLDMSKIESGKLSLNLTQVSLREVMENVVGIVQPQTKAKHQQFEAIVYGIAAEEVYCDSVRLNQVLLNFLSNAMKFTPEGGSIQVVLYEEDSAQGEEYVRVHLKVRDTGIGMSEEFQKTIFESFTREESEAVQKTEGTGLGMAIVKYIVDALHGAIDLKSAPGEGTEFHVVLDLERVAEKEKPAPLPACRVLAVGGSQGLGESTVEKLGSLGLEADWTGDREEAARMAGDYRAVLLCQEAAAETARLIREKYRPENVVLLVAAYDCGELERELRELGVDGYLSRPLFPSTLYEGLSQFLEAHREEQAQEDDSANHLAGCRLLVAEDNELNWEIVEVLLSDLGMELDWAENGQVCVEKFQASVPGRYDAVLMDMRMPVMDGCEATRRIRAMDRPDAAAIPIIAMTADAFSDDIDRCLESGMNAHIAKPFDLQKVLRLLEDYLDRGNSGRGGGKTKKGGTWRERH